MSAAHPSRTWPAAARHPSGSVCSGSSPALAGALFAAGYEAWPQIICGVLKIAYDVALLWMFRHTRPPEER